MPWTASRDPAFPLMRFYTPLFMYDMWAIECHRKETDQAGITLTSLVHITSLVISCGVVGMLFDPDGSD